MNYTCVIFMGLAIALSSCQTTNNNSAQLNEMIPTKSAFSNITCDQTIEALTVNMTIDDGKLIIYKNGNFGMTGPFEFGIEPVEQAKVPAREPKYLCMKDNVEIKVWENYAYANAVYYKLVKLPVKKPDSVTRVEPASKY